MNKNKAFYMMYKDAKGEYIQQSKTKTKNKSEGKSESTILKECLAVLDLLNIYHWRQNTGAFKTANGGFFRSSMAGVSDIIGILPTGKFLAIECKREIGGVLSIAQKTFLQKIVDNNGVAIVTNNSEQLKTILKGIIKNEAEKN